MWSVPPTPECQCWLLHTSYPSNQTFHSLSIQDALANIQKNAQSLLLTTPRGVLPVWCWAGNGQFTLCGTFSVLLFCICSSRVVVVHLACLACTTIQRWVPSVRVMRKKSILVEDSWTSCQLVFHQVWRDAFCNLALQFIWFLLPPILHLSPLPVGISFSQDQVTWFQWNGIGIPIILPLLSLHLWCGLHLSLFKGLPQSFT